MLSQEPFTETPLGMEWTGYVDAGMKTAAFALTIALFISAVTGALIVRIVNANPYQDGRYARPTIQIDSPMNKTYTGLVLLNFSIVPPENWLADRMKVNSVNYWVDWKFPKLINVNSSLYAPFNYSAILENLTNGNHEVRIAVDSVGWFEDPVSGEISYPTSTTTATAFFTFDTASSAQIVDHIPATLLIGSVIGVAAVAGLGLLIYLKKRHR